MTDRPQIEESFRGIGLEVFLTKPLALEEILAKVNKSIGVADAQASEEEYLEQSIKKIMVCGPIQFPVEEMASQLRTVGCKMQTATSGIDALDKALEFNPDIILLDVAMGDTHGYKVVKILRNMSKTLNKVILVYNYALQEGAGSLSAVEKMGSEEYNSSVCMLAGATEFLGKFNASAFLTRMHHYLYA